MTKDELFELAGYDITKIDYALPQSFFDECVQWGIKEPLLIFSWIYDEQAPTFGRPLSTGEAWARAFEKEKIHV